MRKYVITVLLAALPWWACAAPASDKSIEELLEITKVESLIPQVMGSVEQQMQQTMLQVAGTDKLNPKQAEVMKKFTARWTDVMREETDYKSVMKPMYLRIYRESFTQEEMDGMIAFYKTPAGQALINKMPAVMQKTMAILQTETMPRMIGKMRGIVEELAPEMKAASQEEKAPAKPKKQTM